MDIFKKQVEKEIEKEVLEITADHREKNSLVISELVSHSVKVNMEHLEVADFIVNDVAIERKTVSDFLSSMISKRLFFQLNNMKQFERSLLIIEGIEEHDIYSELEEMNPNAVRGFILSILLEHKVPIVFTKNYEDTAKYLLVLAKKKDSSSESLRAKRKTFSLDEQRQFVLEGFPGIGAKTAKKLLERFRSIKNIITADEEELKMVLGKKYETLKKIID